jgi:ankyrin repeat protein
MKETASEFRDALAMDLRRAGLLLVKHPSLIDYPVYGSSESALHFFATEDRCDIVAWLLQNGASSNGIGDDNSPLHAAAQLGHRDVCQALIRGGADLDRRDSLGETALHKASSGGYLEIIRDLLDSGADPSITETCGEAPIDQALPRKRDQVRAVFEDYRNSGKQKT